MGTGIGLKCPKCSFHKQYYLGSGMLLPETYAKVIDGINEYEYGSEWYDYFKTHTGAAVDVNKEIYHCRLCNAIVEEYNLDLYNRKDGSPPDYGYFTSWTGTKEYDFVKHYAHRCPICDGRMRIIRRSDLKALPCPRCGTTLISSDDFIWD